MQEKERASLLAGVFRIQIIDALHGAALPEDWNPRQAAVLFVSGRSVKKAEVDVRILIGEIASFQLVEQLADLLLIEQQRWHDDEGGRLCGNAF